MKTLKTQHRCIATPSGSWLNPKPASALPFSVGISSSNLDWDDATANCWPKM